MKKINYVLVIVLLLFSVDGFSQYSIEICQKKARENFPMIVQYGLIESSKDFKIENANKNYLPQVSFSVKATYQSEVTQIPVAMPGVTPLSKDQYNAIVQIEQNIWDGGLTVSQKESTKAQTNLEKSKLDVDIYALRERVNQLFFGIILLNEQLVQIGILKNDLRRSYDQVNAFIANGIANQSDIDAIKVEQINTLQKETEILSNKEAFISMLSAMIGEKIKTEAILEKPRDLTYSNENKRPELAFFNSQSAFYDSQAGLIAAKNRMKLGAFVQAGYGKPGLNMLKNEFSPYYIAGVRLVWNLGGLYTQKNEIKMIDINKSIIESQKAIFLYNTNLKSTQQEVAIKKTKSLMERDDELISLRESIKKAAEIKLENGTISVSELLREINLLDIVRNNRARHEIELMMAIYDYRNTINN